jgi:hypothetical protein
MNWYKKAQEKPNPLDGKNNNMARKIVHRLIEPYTHDFYTDNDWSNIQKLFKILNDAGINYTMTDASYYHDEHNRPMGKIWKLEIYFTNNNNKPTTLYGTLTAHGAGTIEDPTSKYDVTFIVF